MICFFKLSQPVAKFFLLATTSFTLLAQSGEERVITHQKSATLSYSFVGMLMKGSSSASYWPHCTATLVSPDQVLTARHCVKNLHGNSLKVFFPFEGFSEVSIDGISEFCKDPYDHCSKRIDDLVLIKLSSPYIALPTAQLGHPTDLNISDEKTIVGFGLDEGTLPDNGIKREGRIVLNRCNKCTPPDAQNSAPSDDHRSLCFGFGRQETDPAGLNRIGNQHGDSGGPMLNPGIELHPIVGVARQADWTCSERNQKEGQYVNLTHSKYRDWLSNAFYGRSRQAISIKHVSKLLEVDLARLDHDDTQDDYQVDIQPDAQKLIVTMNHTVGGWGPDPSDLDVILDLNADCTRYIGVEVCTVDKPASGSHTVSVKRIHKSAAYQLAAIAIYTTHSITKAAIPASGGK